MGFIIIAIIGIILVYWMLISSTKDKSEQIQKEYRFIYDKVLPVIHDLLEKFTKNDAISWEEYWTTVVDYMNDISINHIYTNKGKIRLARCLVYNLETGHIARFKDLNNRDIFWKTFLLDPSFYKRITDLKLKSILYNKYNYLLKKEI